MGRVKIAPTPRNTALNDAMRRAAANITSSSSHNVELARPLPLPDPPSRQSAKQPLKSAAKPQPPQVVARLSREATKDRSSVESQKRKSESIEPSAPPSKKAATDKLVLRSASTLAPTSKEQTSDKATSRASSKANSVEPTRRSTRSNKTASTVTTNSAVESKSTPANKPGRAGRAQKKTVKAAPNSSPEENARKAAVVMLQGEEILQDGEAAENTDSPSAARSTQASLRANSSQASTPAPTAPATPVIQSISTLDPALSASPSGSPSPANNTAATDTVHSASPVMVTTSPLNNNVALGLPINTYGSPPPPMVNHSVPVAYAYPAPDVTPVPYPYGHMNGFHTDPTHTYHPNGYMAAEKALADGGSASSADSGYVTSQPFQMHPYMNAPSLYNNGFVPPYPPLLPANQMPPIHFVSHTKGQKVKGRPTPRNAKTPEDDRNGRNIANTYPRKQPFKAQIEFPGYPPANAPIPRDYTLWEVCQNFPNSLRENSLLPFVQREWSANEVCACLKEDAREILNSRPGKDKTMVFQKRMERIKKDLIAKGEYEELVHGDMMREDGRPTWVKRGNVRRK
jgi:hypothetical protein